MTDDIRRRDGPVRTPRPTLVDGRRFWFILVLRRCQMAESQFPDVVEEVTTAEVAQAPEAVATEPEPVAEPPPAVEGEVEAV
jgi:hypothetical protein